jgi:DNA-binding SARP family transcriptional activator
LYMSNLQMRFFGDFEIKAGEEPVSTLTKPRLQSLLAYLLLNRDSPQFRHHLAGLFYPESTEAQALTNLRNLLYQLRQALPDGEKLIRADNQAIQWNSEIPVLLDVFEFQHMLSQETPQNLSLQCLESAVSFYRGDLLPGCYEEWITTKREQYRQMFFGLLSQLIERYESLRHYPDAIAACRKLITADPLHKDGYPRLVSLLALNGEASAALKVYHEYVRLLKRELDLEPPAELQALYQYTRRTARQRESAQGFSTPGALAGQLPLVNRHAEWQSLQAVWKIAEAGQPRMLILRGEAGIGKTRLAEELMGWAARLGIRSAAAHCYASEGALPYAPMVEWLRALGLPPLERVWQSELSRLLPELLKDGKKAPPPLTEAWQRLRLFEALARAILGLRQKTLLLIEDIHWCDRDTLEWLHYLLRFDERAPLLIVGTERSEEADSNPAYGRLLESLRREYDQDGLEIELGPLNEAETAQLAMHAAGKVLDRGINALIYQETEGSPLFIVEMVRAELYKTGRLPGVQSLPYKARSVLENCIRQLSPGAREIILLAAAIGHAFTLDVLLIASGCAENELVQGMEELLHRRFVREISQNRYDFSHDRLREAVLSEASIVRRQMTHHQVADALIHISSHGLESISGEIASHYEAAGYGGQAVEYYHMAARMAGKIFANHLAIEYYRRAISLVEGPLVPGFPSQVLAELFEEFGETLALVGQFTEAHVYYERALSQPYVSPAIWRAQIYRRMSHVLQKVNRLSEALLVLDQAEQILCFSERSPLPERQEWLQIQLARSDALYWGNHPDQMDEIHQRILPIIQAEGRPDQHVELLSQQIMARFRHERYRLSAETVEIARRRLELVRAMNVPYDTAWAQFHMGFALLWRGELAEARAYLQKAYYEALRMEAGLLQVRCLAYLCFASRQMGDVEAVRNQCPRLWDLALQIQEPGYQGLSQANQGWLAWREGNMHLAESLCASAKTIWAQSGGFMFPWLADWVLLDIAVSHRDLTQVEALIRSLLDPNPFFQPVLEPVHCMLEEAFEACQKLNGDGVLERCSQALNMVKASGDL